MSAGARPIERRLFVGLDLDEVARDACARAAERLRAAGFAATYEDAAKFHVTLAFLGNVADVRCSDVVATMRQTALRRCAVDVVLDKLGAFPHERRPRIVYAGAREQGDGFRTLAAAVREAYEERGFHFFGDSVAHVTLARVKAPQRPLPPIDIVPIPVRFARLCAFESVFDKEKNTSRYEVFAQEVLGGSSEA
ncbi:MAG: RNA 2',3'-cyclic phosphodiesterase [Candidatus Tumulicola sp.]